MQGYRKFSAAMFAIAGAYVLCYFGKIADGVCSTIVISVFTLFVTGNVAKNVLPASKPPAAPASPPVP